MTTGVSIVAISCIGPAQGVAWRVRRSVHSSDVASCGASAGFQAVVSRASVRLLSHSTAVQHPAAPGGAVRTLSDAARCERV